MYDYEYRGGIFMTVTPLHYRVTSNTSPAAAKRTPPAVNCRDEIKTGAVFNASRLGAYAARLKDALDWLRNGGDFLYRNFYAESADPSAVKVNRTDGKLDAAKDYDVAVGRLATGQTNTGGELYATDVYAGDTGRQTFNIEIDGERHEFTVEIKPGETNEEVLNKIADAVTKEGLGIKASVTKDNDSNSVALVFESEETGDVAGNNFTVNDMIGGNLVEATGIANTTLKARDALYSVNGEVRQSHDNTVDLATGLNVTLLTETGSSSVEVSVKQNAQPALDAIKNFVEAYNDLLNESRISGENNAWLNGFISKMNGVGIFQNDDGSLYYSKGGVEQAVKNGSLEKAFKKINYDGIDSFFNRLI
jgi:flagellar hook-associated protein 2